MTKDWGSEFAARQRAVDNAARLAADEQQMREQHRLMVAVQVKKAVREIILPEFRNFAQGTVHAPSLSVTVEALRGDAPVREDDEALDSIFLTGARIRLTRSNSHTVTLKIGSTDDGQFISEFTSSARGPQSAESVPRAQMASTIEKLLQRLMDMVIPRGA